MASCIYAYLCAIESSRPAASINNKFAIFCQPHGCIFFNINDRIVATAIFQFHQFSCISIASIARIKFSDEYEQTNPKCVKKFHDSVHFDPTRNEFETISNGNFNGDSLKFLETKHKVTSAPNFAQQPIQSLDSKLNGRTSFLQMFAARSVFRYLSFVFFSNIHILCRSHGDARPIQPEQLTYSGAHVRFHLLLK